MSDQILPPHLLPFRAKEVWRDAKLGTMARERAMAVPDAAAIVEGIKHHSFAQIVADAESLAVALLDLRIGRGDVVAFQLPNWSEAAVINLASAMVGATICPIVPIYRDAEVAQMLADSGSKLFFLTEGLRNFDFAAMMGRIQTDLPDLSHTIYVRGMRGITGYEAMLDSGRGRELREDAGGPDAVKLLLYTSGTTGRPKAVLHSQNTVTRTIDTLARHWNIEPGDALLIPSPVTHISGYSSGLEMPFVSGTSSVLMDAWNAATAVKLVDAHNVVGTIAATPFLQELVGAARDADTCLRSLRFFACGGAAVPPYLVREANAAFPHASTFRIFGSSEAPLVTVGFLGPGSTENAAMTDGRVVDYDVRIVDENGVDMVAGLEGEILVRGAAMFVGYADEEQTRTALTADGYFRTGDLGVLTTERALTVTGRKKDLIIRGGENISAKEVEDALHQNPAVLEAAVISIPHQRLGETVGAYVVLREGMYAEPSELALSVANCGLARQKCPERIEIVAELPKTASGKVRKDLLRATARQNA